MKRITILCLSVIWLFGCGVIQIKTRKKFDSNPPTVNAPADADPRIKDTWNQAEITRARVLRDEDRPQLISFGSYQGPCERYIEVYQIDPDFVAGTMFKKVTVQERMEEMCQKAVDYAESCREQGESRGCGDTATVAHIMSVLKGRASGQSDPTSVHKRPSSSSASGASLLQQEMAGRELRAQLKEIYQQITAEQITTCQAISQHKEIEQQIPSEICELYRATMNLERIPPEGIQGFIRPDQIEAAQQATWEQQKIIRTGVQMHLRSNVPKNQRDYIETLITIDGFRRGTYKKAGAGALGKTGVRKDVSTEDLRAWAETFRCLGDYTPSPRSLKGSAIATIMDGEISRLERQRRARAEEEARCQADSECMKQRKIDRVLADLCPLFEEIKEIDARLKARLKEAKKYGVIHKGDQYDDMEDKQFCEEQAADLKRAYRDVAGRKFSKNDCRDY